MTTSESFLLVETSIELGRFTATREIFEPNQVTELYYSERGGNGIVRLYLRGYKVGLEVLGVESASDDLLDLTMVKVDTRSENASRHSDYSGVIRSSGRSFKSRCKEVDEGEEPKEENQIQVDFSPHPVRLRAAPRTTRRLS